MKTLKVIIVASTIGFIGTVGLASSFGPMSYSDLDRNGDGIVTQNEYQKTKELRIKEKKEEGRLLRNSEKTKFSNIDINGDGEITQKEYRIHQQKMFNNRPNGSMGKGMGQNR